MLVEDKLKKLGLSLPPPPKPVANYVPAVMVGNLLYLSGHGPWQADGSTIIGKLGRDLDIDQGYQAARQTALALLATIKDQLGGLGRVKQVVKLLGMVNCTPDFGDQPKVINGASDLLLELYGERGKHARSAVGMASLPRGIPVEIELILEVAD
jgi:enamine deaminase RidA (YjgF/YER057c/UK114 family)